MSIGILLGLLLSSAAFGNTPRASSERTDSEGVRSGAHLAFDGLLSTSWAEGEPGHGEGSWIELALARPADIESVSIWPGNLAEGERTIRETARPKKVRITLSGAGDEVTVEKYLPDLAQHGMQRVDVPIVGKARTVRIDIDEVFEGGIRSDLHIAEVALNFAGGPQPAGADSVRAWAESKVGQAAAERGREEVVALFDQIDDAEFGDRDALRELMERAAEGAPWLRKQVQSKVPAGYRIQALPADEVAVEALLKIKDSNAIPAIDRAAARSPDPVAARFRQYASVFRAHQALVGGGRLSVPPFGDRGWEPGAFQSLGEPLPIEVDGGGRLWVADPGNHRVQRFSRDGRFEQAWGAGEPGVTNAWIGGPRAHYAAGSQPAAAPEGFTAPLDVAFLADKKGGDRLAVLDAAGFISLIGPEDRVVGHWQVPAQDRLVTGVGGQAHLTWVKSSLVAVWGEEAFVYTADGTEVATFTIEDGAASGAVALGGKLGLIVGRNLVMYSLDGFRHGDVMQGALGSGYESWGLALDERGKLWAVTDDGQLARFKKPGKVDFTVRVDTILKAPRLAVRDGVAFVADDDRILRLDALELQAKDGR